MEAAAKSRCPNCFTAPLSTPCRRCGWASGLDNPPPALALGTLLDERYRIGRVLGHGGFGITYLAWDENLHLRLAVKEYLPRDSATRAPDGVSLAVYSGSAAEQFAYGLERFLEEARALARFDQHPGIVTVKSFFRAHGTGYSVMEFVDGLTLKQYLAQQPEGRLPFDQAMKLLMPVMDALRAVHKDGLLHRDITPDNIYLSQDGRVKLLDFGAARFAAGEHSRSLSVILKPGYAPEEQYRTRGQQGPWTDVYSLAATLYRAITGQVPPEALDRLDADELVPPSQLGAVIAPEQEAVLVRALAVRASARFESVEVLQNAWKEAAVIVPQPEDSGVSSSDTSPDTDPLLLEKSTKLEQRDGVHDGDSHSNSPQTARSKSMPVWAVLASLGLFGSIVLAAWLLNVPDSFDTPQLSAEIDRPSKETGQSNERLAEDRPEDVRREEPQSQFNEPTEIHRSQDLNTQTESIHQYQMPEEPDPQSKPLQFDNYSSECQGRENSLEFVTCGDIAGSAISLLKRMIVTSSDNGGVGHEDELDRIIRQIESLPRPAIVDRKISRSENEKGLAVFREDRFDEAKHHFLSAYQKNPSDPEVADNLSYTYLQLGDLQSAVDMIAKALTLSPSRATAWNQLANYYAQKRQFVESVACFALTFRYSRNRDRTRQVLQQLASENPNPNVRYSANKALNLDFIKNNSITIGRIADAIPRSAPEGQMTTPVDTSRSISERGRELAGLRQGMSYSQAREIILGAGWQGKNRRWQDISQYGQEKEIYYKNNWREVASCAGTGTSPCRFEFHDIHSHLLVIITEGECLNAQFEVPKEGETCDLTVSSWFID